MTRTLQGLFDSIIEQGLELHGLNNLNHLEVNYDDYGQTQVKKLNRSIINHYEDVVQYRNIIHIIDFDVIVEQTYWETVHGVINDMEIHIVEPYQETVTLYRRIKVIC